MKRNRSHIGIFRGLRFDPDDEMGPNNIFKMVCKNNPRNISHMPVVIFMVLFDLGKNSLFMDRH